MNSMAYVRTYYAFINTYGFVEFLRQFRIHSLHEVYDSSWYWRSLFCYLELLYSNMTNVMASLSQHLWCDARAGDHTGSKGTSSEVQETVTAGACPSASLGVVFHFWSLVFQLWWPSWAILSVSFVSQDKILPRGQVKYSNYLKLFLCAVEREVRLHLLRLVCALACYYSCLEQFYCPLVIVFLKGLCPRSALVLVQKSFRPKRRCGAALPPSADCTRLT